MIWLIISKVFLLFIGVLCIIKGFKITRDTQKKEEFINQITVYDASIFQTVLLFVVSKTLKVMPVKLIKIFLILLGVILIYFGIIIVPLK